KEHFAADYYEGHGSERRFVHKAYCNGRAHESDGWLPIEELAQFFRENPRDVFEREWLGWASHAIGKGCDPQLLDAAELRDKALSRDLEQHRTRFQLLEKAVGLDYGFSGQSALCFVVRLRDALVVYRWQFFSGVSYTKIREHLLKMCLEENVET